MQARNIALITFLIAKLGFGEVILDTSFENIPVGTLPPGFIIRYDGKGRSYQVVTDRIAHTGVKSLQLWGVPYWCANLVYPFDVFGKRYVIVSWYQYVTPGQDGWISLSEQIGGGLGYCSWDSIAYKTKHRLEGTSRYVDHRLVNVKLNDWNKITLVLDTKTTECSVFVNNRLVKKTYLDFTTGREKVSYFLTNGETINYSYPKKKINRYRLMNSITLGDCPGNYNTNVDSRTYIDDLQIEKTDVLTSMQENMEQPSEEYKRGFRKGVEWCRKNPEKCGIKCELKVVPSISY